MSLSADGNTAIVGGLYDNTSVGAAWVWTRSAGVWTQQGSKLVGSGAVGNVLQGFSVSLSGDGNTAIVGGPYDDYSHGGAGAARVWTRNAGVWTQQGNKLVGSGAVGNALQGFSASLSGDGSTAIVAGPYDNSLAGAAWVFTTSAPVVPPAPTISAVNPPSGPTTGGTAVTITGTNFVSGATVTIGAVAANVFSVTATTIYATAPTHAAGVVDVVVQNSDGQMATLVGGFTFSATPPEQTPPNRGDLPAPPGLWPTPSRNAVVITHGWLDRAAPTLDHPRSWVKEMAEAVCGKLGASQLALPVANLPIQICQSSNWDVWAVDWQGTPDRPMANTAWDDPMGAYLNASSAGDRLASLLKIKNYSHIHFIAHSAGANLIESATRSLKDWVRTDNRPPLEIHDTFLDAYDPVQDVTSYGKQADWTDNYVDRREVAGLFGADLFDGTKLFLQNGYNIDVTPTPLLDPCMQLLLLPDVFECRHDRPYRFYGLSIDPFFVGNGTSKANDPIAATGGAGYPLSLENGHPLSALNSIYPKGKKCVMGGGSCYADSLPPSVLSLLPGGSVVVTVVDATVDAVSDVVGVVATVDGTVLNFLRLGMKWLLPGFDKAGRMSLASAATDSPSWITVQVATTQPVNTMRFNWRFAAAGEGFLRVFVDGSLVREIDQRYVSLASPAAEQIYIGGGAGALAPGIHRIAFRFDGFGTSASGVELTAVELGLTAVSAPVVPVAGSFFSTSPCRVLDTRNPTGPLGAPSLQPFETRSFNVAGICGVPADAIAISANLTVTNVGATGELVVFPSDILRPNTSTVSFRPGRARANNSIISFSKSSTTFSVFNNSGATADFIVDVNGVFR